MKNYYRLLTLFTLLITWEESLGETYYFSSSQGNDNFSKIQAQSLNTPWQSLEKLNAIIPLLHPHDIIRLKCGDIFYGNIQLLNLPPNITIEGYGSGDKPIITSLQSSFAWDDLGGNIYKTEIDDDIIDLNVVLSNSTLLEMGRHPNSNSENNGYMLIEKIKDGKIINKTRYTDDDFSGAEIVIRKNNWIIDRHPLIWHLQESYFFLDSLASYAPSEGFGFFIQNHLETLDREGEWFYNKDEKKLYIYTENPLDEISIASKKNLIFISNCQNLQIRDLHFKGANESLATVENSKFVSFQNCTFSESGIYGLNAISTDFLKIENSSFANHLNGGVFLRWNDKNTTIKNCSFYNTYPYAGMGQNGDMQGQVIYMSEHSEAGLIDSNIIKNSGYIAINFNGSDTKVTNNIIDTYCNIKDDGAAIYTVSGNKNLGYTNRVVAYNKIINGIGARKGTKPYGKNDFPYVEGIYIDDNSRNVLVKENTLSNINGSGIFIHNAQEIEIIGNSIYKTAYGIKMANDDLGINIRNIFLSENLIINEFDFQKFYKLRSVKEDIKAFGNFENNNFINLVNDSKPFEINYLKNSQSSFHEELSIETWRKNYGFDNNSIFKNISSNSIKESSIRVMENNTNEPLSIELEENEKILNENVTTNDKLFPNKTAYIINTGLFY